MEGWQSHQRRRGQRVRDEPMGLHQMVDSSHVGDEGTPPGPLSMLPSIFPRSHDSVSVLPIDCCELPTAREVPLEDSGGAQPLEGWPNLMLMQAGDVAHDVTELFEMIQVVRSQVHLAHSATSDRHLRSISRDVCERAGRLRQVGVWPGVGVRRWSLTPCAEKCLLPQHDRGAALLRRAHVEGLRQIVLDVAPDKLAQDARDVVPDLLLKRVADGEPHGLGVLSKDEVEVAAERPRLFLVWVGGAST
mmetsp:Transcript_74105/g.154563  ORF Transcript_74105/g.154563 Transcript_74105/m.154563 type:complete len:247 (+) Transcript_74105:900-1640(+)